MAFRRVVGSVMRRGFATQSKKQIARSRVAILGAAGGIGQCLSLLLKLNPLVSHLALYDVTGAQGVAADISHLNTRAEVEGYEGEENLDKVLRGSDLVVISAGASLKPGMSQDDLFVANARIVESLCMDIANYSPFALVNIVSNHINSIVPMAAETFKLEGTYDHRRLFGVTTLDVVRARTFYAEKKLLPVKDVNVPVVGGHSGITILPLFSQATPQVPTHTEELVDLTKRTQDAGTEVFEAREGKGSAKLAMAYAGALFAEACLKGLNGVKDVVECSYVASSVTDLPFFSSKVQLGVDGIERTFELGELSEYEQFGLEKVQKELSQAIEKGQDFIHQSF